MKILIDNNVLVDYLAKREPFFAAAREIFSLCYMKKISGYVAAHTITDCIYILRDIPLDKRREMILEVFNYISVIGVDREKLLSALTNFDFDDIEDCLQAVCAESLGLDYIVTRNGRDFAGSKVLPVTPSEFLFKLKLINPAPIGAGALLFSLNGGAAVKCLLSRYRALCNYPRSKFCPYM